MNSQELGLESSIVIYIMSGELRSVKRGLIKRLKNWELSRCHLRRAWGNESYTIMPWLFT